MVSPTPMIAWGIALCFTYIALCFVFHITVRSPWYVMLVQNVLSKQAGSWNLISVSSYCAVCLVKQVKFCKCKSWNTTSMLKTKNVQLLPRVGKIKRTLHSYWLPKQARLGHFVHLGFPMLVPQVKVLFLAT